MIAIEFGIVVWIGVVGVVACAGMWSRAPLGLGLVAPIIGSALYAVSGVFVLAAGVFTTTTALALATGFAVTLFTVSSYRAGTWRHRGFMTALVVTLGLCASTVVVNHVLAPTRMTPDSIGHLLIAGSLERSGELPALLPIQLVKRQFVTGVMHSGGVVSGLGHLSSLTSMIAAAGAAFSLWLGWDALQRRGVAVSKRLVAVGSVGALVLSTNRILYNIFYINGHGLFAAYLVVSVGLLWAAAHEGDWDLSLLAGIAAAVLVPLRPEGMIVLATFLAAAFAYPRTPRRGIWSLVVPVAVVALVWNGVGLRSALPADEFTLTSTPVLTMAIAIGLVILALGRQFGILGSAFRWLPLATTTAVIGYTIVRVAADEDLFFDLLTATGANLLSEGLWTAFWLVVPLAVTACAALTVVQGQGFFLWGLLTYPFALIAFAYLRGTPYRVGAGDSANRMLMHVVFVLALYLVVAVGHIALSIPDKHWTAKAIVQEAKRVLTSV